MEFKDAVTHIFEFEGGYVNDSRDGGGETKYGISQRSWPSLDIKNLTKAQAECIYKRHYWEATSCDELPPRIRLMVFDCAVNQGVFFAARTLQRSVDVRVDGVIGPVTIFAARCHVEGPLLYKYFTLRAERYQSLKNFDHFGAGWMKRLKHVALLCGGVDVA